MQVGGLGLADNRPTVEIDDSAGRGAFELHAGNGLEGVAGVALQSEHRCAVREVLVEDVVADRDELRAALDGHMRLPRERGVQQASCVTDVPAHWNHRTGRA